MNLSKTLRELTRRHSLTVPRLAAQTGVPVNTLHNWLAGQSPRRLEQVKLVADHFGVSLEYLLFGVESKVAPQDLHALLSSGQFEIVLRKAPR
ncbi:MAG TPA: helix-turn-helix transcriptional regulator [Pseudobdellovibrionaceae bacterium]|nr:helix-turn-helix transcriptional regulator [Pseudobdellovibrionaceae bacterium]